MTQTYASPSTERLIADFKAEYGDNVNHVTYDAISEDAALNAFECKPMVSEPLPDYDFEKADVIVLSELISWEIGKVVDMIVAMPKDVFQKMGKCPSTFSWSPICHCRVLMRISVILYDSRSQQKIALAKLYGKLNGTNVGGGTSANVDEAVGKHCCPN